MTNLGEANMLEGKIIPAIIPTNRFNIVRFNILKITFNINRGSALGSKYILN